MVEDSRDANSMSPLIEFLRIKQQREGKIDEQIVAYLNREELPTPDDIRNVINSRVGEQRQHLLRHHVYWKERQLRLGLESLIRAAHQAYVDICRHDAALGSLARGKDFQDHVDHTVGYTAQKDMMAYCSLAIAVHDTLHSIYKVRPAIEGEIRKIANECFDHDVTCFVKDLRNNLSHGSVVIPKWEISSDFQNLSGSMIYGASELLSYGDWASESKKYLTDASGGTINLSTVVGEHFKLLEAFDRKIQDLFAENVNDAERDFFEIEDSYKRVMRTQWAKIQIGQIGRNKDPYEYLHWFFNPETVREILRFALGTARSRWILLSH